LQPLEHQVVVVDEKKPGYGCHSALDSGGTAKAAIGIGSRQIVAIMISDS
jgi:hypothetical protein